MAWLLSLISDRALYMVIWMVENPITIADSIYFKSKTILTLSPHHPRTIPSAIVLSVARAPHWFRAGAFEFATDRLCCQNASETGLTSTSLPFNFNISDQE